MNYNMFLNTQSERIDPNYIYPRPYIDPMVYMNPYMTYGQFAGYQANPTINGYVTYTNPYAENPLNPDLSQVDNDSIYPTIEDINYSDVSAFADNNMSNYPNMNIPNMQGVPGMGMPNMQGMPGTNMPNMQSMPIYPGMFPGMFPMPNMMYPGMFPGMFPMPNMMYPGMFPGMPQINMEEFDEEEM